ncbi:MAG TPA: hypothetical protein VF546_23155 [Pyrinomonadaceae bacterium]|jgi:hypothetical protein
MRAVSGRAGLFFLACLLAAAVARAQPAGQMLIVGDASGSMQGFAKAGTPRLAALYQLLYRNAGAVPPQLVALTSDPATRAPRLAPVAQAGFFGTLKSYRGDTDLVFALQQMQQRGGLNVFATDGMQSGGTYLQVKEQLLRMVRDGWGVWLLAVKLPFDGTFDPEQPLDLETARGAIEQCARQDDPRAVISYKPGSTRFYNYAGLKPLLLFVLTKDIGAGRDLTQRLAANLKADPQYSAQVAELAPLFYRGVSFAAAQPASDFMRVEEGADGVVIHSDPVADEELVKEVLVPVVWGGEQPPIPQPFVERPTFMPPGEVSWVPDTPEVSADESDPEGKRTPGRFRVRFVSELAWYRRFCTILPFISCDEAKPDPLDLQVWTEFHEAEAPWWGALNTDNSYECPARVYKLAELAHDLAQAAKERLNPEARKVSKSLKLIVGRV